MSPFLALLLPVLLALGTIGFYNVARIYVLPQLKRGDLKPILLPILLLNSFRYLGLTFLMPGATNPGLPAQYAYPDALGDLTAAALAFIAIPLVMRSLSAARPVLWALTVEGALDLLSAISLGAIFHVSRFLGPSYWIVVLYVPALLVAHYVTFLILTGSESASRQSLFAEKTAMS